MRKAVVDIVATHQHFVDHLAPVWRAMPPEMRGGFFTTDEFDPGLEGERSPRAGRGDLTLVCSYGDLISAIYGDESRPVVFMEHGAGMTFESAEGVTHASYSGSTDRPNVALFLAPNQYVVDANRRTHPYTPSAIIGSPKMDRWYPAPLSPKDRGARGKKPVVAVAFHWDCHLSPGTRSAFNHFSSALPALAAAKDFDVIGHAHPRDQMPMKMACLEAGIPFVQHIDDVFDQADVFVADATSALYEFASLDRPVVVMNDPWYFKEPDDGVRFWKEIPGVQVNHPDELVDTIRVALHDSPEIQTMRREAVMSVYPVKGSAAETAVRAIQHFQKNLPLTP